MVHMEARREHPIVKGKARISLADISVIHGYPRIIASDEREIVGTELW